MHDDGLIAIPVSFGAYWYNALKKGGRIKPNFLQPHVSHFKDAYNSKRPFQIGEKLYLTNMSVTPVEIAVYVQSCGTCDPAAVDPNDSPYVARLAFQFDKGYLTTADPKEVLETVGRVFGIDTSAPKQKSQQPSTTPAAPVPAPVLAMPLKLPSTYVSAQTPADQLQLNADNSFSLQEAGQTYRGTFATTGNTLELNIRDTNTKTALTIQSNGLTDSSGQAWALREQMAQAVAAETLLQNQDVIKMVKAGLDDALIIAKISGSKCQFDTSTDALIQLKSSGVSAAVLKAIVSAIVVDPFPGTSVHAERAPLVATHAAYFGVWNNVQRGGYVKVIISGNSEKPRVHLWGSCLPRDCDWGEADGHWDGSALTTAFQRDNVPIEFRLTLDGSSNLQLNCHLPNGKDCVTMSYTRAILTRQ
jgi:hypothetical protein